MHGVCQCSPATADIAACGEGRTLRHCRQSLEKTVHLARPTKSSREFTPFDDGPALVPSIWRCRSEAFRPRAAGLLRRLGKRRLGTQARPIRGASMVAAGLGQGPSLQSIMPTPVGNPRQVPLPAGAGIDISRSPTSFFGPSIRPRHVELKTPSGPMEEGAFALTSPPPGPPPSQSLIRPCARPLLRRPGSPSPERLPSLKRQPPRAAKKKNRRRSRIGE